MIMNDNSITINKGDEIPAGFVLGMLRYEKKTKNNS